MPITTPSLSSLLQAIEFASEKHRDQRRKGVDAHPYINHPIQVATLLATVAEVTDLVVLMAAVLHDTLEDTLTSEAELDQHFGVEVRKLVSAVTDDKQLPKEARKWLQVEHAPHIPPAAKLVKLADKICNVRDVTHNPPLHWTTERRALYLDWAEQVVLGCRGVCPALEACFDGEINKARALMLMLSQPV